MTDNKTCCLMCLVTMIILIIGSIAGMITLGVLYGQKISAESSTSTNSILQLGISSQIITRSEDISFLNSLFSSSKYPKQMKLIYRGSQNGWAVGNFHSAVDNKGAVFSIIQVKESKRVCGGYNPIGFGSSVPATNLNYSPDGVMPGIFESFLYSLDSKRQFYYENNYSQEGLNAYANFPVLGWDQGWGLAVPSGTPLSPNLNGDKAGNAKVLFGYNIPVMPRTKDTSILTGVSPFTVEEIEVFQVIF